MRRVLTIVLATALAAAAAHAAAPLTEARKGTPVPVAPWVLAADVAAVKSADAAHAMTRPAVLVETNYPAFDPAVNPDMELYLSVDPNGYSSPVTMYVYWQDRVSGQRRYFTATDGLLPEHEVADLFGNDDPLPVWAPDIYRLKLLGPSQAAFGAAPAQPTGRYMFVVELRDLDGARVIARGTAMYSFVSTINVVSGDITADTTLDADRLHILQGAVFVRSGATLTIEPGTVVFGDTASKGTLVIAQGGKVNSAGTPDNPVIMTSPAPLGQRQPQDWGGVILNGYAPLNVPGGTSSGEGDTGTYGGGATPDPGDDSGTITYTRVEFAGIEFSPDNELNGIAFQGVGSGGTFHHIQVHFNQDDAIEFFGGTAQVKYMLLTAGGDDTLDWTEGWQGKAQFIVGIQNGTRADHIVEADNWETDNNAEPRANSQIYNATFVGAGDTGDQGDDALKLRRGTAGQFYNWVVYGAREHGIDVDDDATAAQVASGALRLAYSVVNGNGSWTGKSNLEDGDATTLFTNGPMNRDVDPMLASPFYYLVPDVAPLAGSPLLDAGYVKSPPGDGFFEPVDFAGAVGPGHNWTLEGWTIWSKN